MDSKSYGRCRSYLGFLMSIELLLLLLRRFSCVNSVRPHRWQLTRLPCAWDFPGKNTGVGCHFLLQCMKVKSEREVAQSCPTLSDPMGGHGSSAHGIFQARVLEWGASAFSMDKLRILQIFNFCLNICLTIPSFSHFSLFTF